MAYSALLLLAVAIGVAWSQELVSGMCIYICHLYITIVTFIISA